MATRAARPARPDAASIVWLTEAELCTRWRCGRDRLRQLRDQGLPYSRLGRQLRYDFDAVTAWLADNR
jgi:hypothetical protein